MKARVLHNGAVLILAVGMMLALIGESSGEDDSAWHIPGNVVYANMTIDDPNLMKSSLDYAGLEKVIEPFNGHVTIGVIGSQANQRDEETVARFKKGHFSIAPHGFVHACNEFGAGTPKAVMRQALWMTKRAMDDLKRETGIEPAPVFIFPCEDTDLNAVLLLEQEGFDAFVKNPGKPVTGMKEAGIPPWDSLLPASLAAGGVPMIRRDHYLPVPASASLARQPLCFYTHGNDFSYIKERMEELSKAPFPVKWTDLGTIALNLYRQKKNGDGTWSVQMFTRRAQITNSSQEPRTYHFERKTPTRLEVEEIQVARETVDWYLEGDKLTWSAEVQPSETVLAEIIWKRSLEALQPAPGKWEVVPGKPAYNPAKECWESLVTVLDPAVSANPFLEGAPVEPAIVMAGTRKLTAPRGRTLGWLPLAGQQVEVKVRIAQDSGIKTVKGALPPLPEIPAGSLTLLTPNADLASKTGLLPGDIEWHLLGKTVDPVPLDIGLLFDGSGEATLVTGAQNAVLEITLEWPKPVHALMVEWEANGSPAEAWTDYVEVYDASKKETLMPLARQENPWGTGIPSLCVPGPSLMRIGLEGKGVNRLAVRLIHTYFRKGFRLGELRVWGKEE